MSTKSKLLAMTENLQLPEDAPRNVEGPAQTPMEAQGPPAVGISQPQSKFPHVATGAVPRTGPGQMLQFRGQMLAVEGELGKLRDRELLKLFNGTLSRFVEPGQHAFLGKTVIANAFA